MIWGLTFDTLDEYASFLDTLVPDLAAEFNADPEEMISVLIGVPPEMFEDILAGKDNALDIADQISAYLERHFPNPASVH